ncbi:MAG: alpha/beta hydrolase [Chloroflexi bacterium]|nr:alpha/beta hydrolase [Chloroflexota bacterium]
MPTVKSKDGTPIAFEKKGTGPAVIVVDGALCYRASGPSGPLAELLQPYFTVYTYDRRGRGESGDTQPYAVEREVEDIEALINAAGGSAYVYGISSGAALALEAASRIKGIQKLALYEAPFIVDDSHPPRPDDYLARMDGLIAANRRGDALRMFMRTVGVPVFFVMLMRFMPAWSKLKGIAHTLPYDFRILGDTGSGKPLPAERWSPATMPTLVMDGGKSPDWMRNAMRSLSQVLPSAQYRTLDGQTHMLKPEALTPVLVEFFNGR